MPIPVSTTATEAILYALAAGVIWGIAPCLLKKGMAESSVSMATQFARSPIVGCPSERWV